MSNGGGLELFGSLKAGSGEILHLPKGFAQILEKLIREETARDFNMVSVAE